MASAITLQQITEILDEAKAYDITTLDVKKLTTITDHMIICCGRSNRHIKSIAERLVQVLKENGMQPQSVEGTQNTDWVLVDADEAIVHIMLPSARAHYNLEQLWSEEFGQLVESMGSRTGEE